MSDIFQPHRLDLADHLKVVLRSFAEQAATGVAMQSTTDALADELAAMMVRLAADALARGEERASALLVGAVASGAVH